MAIISLAVAIACLYGCYGVSLPDPLPIFVLLILSAIETLTAIILFKKRNIQHILSFSAIFISLVALLLFMYNVRAFNDPKNILGAWMVPAGALAAILFNMLAIKGVRNDEKLLKSMDRLR